MMPFTSLYKYLLEDALNGVEEMNKRTESKIRATPEGASFVINLSDDIIPTCGLRKTSPHIAAAEVAWCLRGDNHVDWLRKHTSVWNDFADPAMCVKCDGAGRVQAIDDFGFLPAHTDAFNTECAFCHGTGKALWLDAAYGYRWRTKFGRDQLVEGIDALKLDPSNRRVWISSWDPVDDMFDGKAKTVPCPVGFTLSVLAEKLNSTLMIRSSDLYMGLPYDVMRHAMLLRIVADELWLKKVGCMRVTLAHPHLYERHFDLAQKMIELMPVVPNMAFSTMSMDHILNDPDKYVEDTKKLAVQYQWPIFNPKSEVVR